MATKMQMKAIMTSPAVTGILVPVKVTAVRMPVAICIVAMMLPHTMKRGFLPCLHTRPATVTSVQTRHGCSSRACSLCL